MKAALLALSLALSACAQPRQCPPLPEQPADATPAQQLNHTAVLIRLYAQCAGARP